MPMFAINTYYVQRSLPLQFAFKLFETRAFFPLSRDKQAFASVGREFIDARLDIMQFILAPFELRLRSRADVISVC